MLPQAVCRLCYRMITKFCIFTCSVESQQNKFKNRLPPDDNKAEEVPCTSKNISKESSDTSGSKRSHDDSNEQPVILNSDNEEGDVRKSKRRKNGGRMAQALNEIKYSDKKERIETVKSDYKIINETELILFQTLCETLLEASEVFKNDLDIYEKTYVKITIKESLLDPETGQVPMSWLKNYKDFTTWDDFIYECQHCNEQIQSLKSLIEHFELHKLSNHKRAIKCTLCPNRVYADQSNNIVLYLNHMFRVHSFEFLKFACFLCDKSKVFVNMVKLTQHMISEHATKKLRLYPCLDCGSFFYCLSKLIHHKKSHPAEKES